MNTIGRPINAVLGARTAMLESGLNRAETRLRTFQNRVDSIGQSLMRAGRYMTLRFTAPLMSGAGFALREFATFDKAMTESTAIMLGLTDDMRKSMGDLAKEISLESAKAPEEIAKGYYYLAQAGFTASQQLNIIGNMTRFAAAGAFDMSSAVDLATDAQSALGLKTQDAALNAQNLVRVTDVLVAASNMANASVRGFSEALTNQVAPGLKYFKKDVEEGVAVLGALADQGEKGLRGGMRFAMFMRYLTQAVNQNAQAWKKYNIDVFEGGNVRKFADILGDMEQSMGRLSVEDQVKALAELGITARVQGTFQMLIGLSQQIREWEQHLRNVGGTTDRVAKNQMQAFANQLRRVWNAVKVVSIEIGEALSPWVLELAERVRTGVLWFRELDASTKRWFGVIGMAAAAAGPLLIVLGFAVSGAAALVAAIPMIAKLGIALGGIIGGGFLLGQAFGISSETIKETFAGIVIWGKDAFGKLVGFLSNFSENMSKLTGWMTENWGAMWDDLVNMSVAFLKNLGHNFVRVFTLVFQEIDARFPSLWDRMVARASRWMVEHERKTAMDQAARYMMWSQPGMTQEQALATPELQALDAQYQERLEALEDINQAWAKDYEERMRTKLAEIEWESGWKEFLDGFQRTTPEIGFNLEWEPQDRNAFEDQTSIWDRLRESIDNMALGDPLPVEQTEDSIQQTAAALEHGSQAAYEAAYTGQNRVQEEISNNTKTIASESVKQTQSLMNIEDALDFDEVSI